jgi:hypothetical protein
MNSEEGKNTQHYPNKYTATRKRSIRSHCLIKYNKNIQQAHERTAAEYQYRLFRLEKYIIAPEQQQNPASRITTSSIKLLRS